MIKWIDDASIWFVQEFSGLDFIYEHVHPWLGLTPHWSSMAPSLDNVVVLKSRELVGEPFSSLESACHIISTHEKRDWHMLDRAQIVLLSFVLVRIGPFLIVKLEALGKLALQPVLFNFD